MTPEEESPLKPVIVAWEPDFAAGHDTLDAQHRALLEQASQLAVLCTGADDPQRARAFDAALEEFKSLVRVHFECEAAELSLRGHTDLAELADELEDFDYMAGEIVTTAHFDRLELQRFLALWSLGHVTGSARWLRSPGPQGTTAP